MIFSEGKDLPGNVLLEQAVRAAFQKGTTKPTEFFTEHLDANRLSDETHYRLFRDYLGAKYAGQEPDLLIIIMARDFALAERLPVEVFRNVPTVFVTSSELPRNASPHGEWNRGSEIRRISLPAGYPPTLAKELLRGPGGEMMSRKELAGRAYSAGLMKPTERPRFWLMRAMRPA